MKRRAFILSSIAAFAAPALSQSSYENVRLRQTRFSGKNKGYNYKRISDPTGNAPSKKVERFELRGGDCSNPGDCKPRPLNGRMVSRTRIERVFIGRMDEGDEGIFSYYVYLPSNEFTAAPSVGSSYGQLLWSFKRDGKGDSTPIFSLDTDSDGHSSLQAAMSEIKLSEADAGRVRHKISKIGSLTRSRSLYNRWHQVQCRFRLSSQRNGLVEPYFNGRSLGRLECRTMTRGGIIEVRYGIYHTGTNQFPGGANAMPTQVAYFSQVGLFKRV